MSTDTGHLQQAVVYTFIYSTSYQTENTGCRSQRPALRVLSLKEMCTPREDLEGGLVARLLSLSLSSSLFLLDQHNNS